MYTYYGTVDKHDGFLINLENHVVYVYGPVALSNRKCHIRKNPLSLNVTISQKPLRPESCVHSVVTGMLTSQTK